MKDMLENNSSLIRLNLRSHKKERHVIPSVPSLIIRTENNITEKGCKMIGEALTKNSTLTALFLDGNGNNNM